MDERTRAMQTIVERLWAAGPDGLDFSAQWLDTLLSSPSLLDALSEVEQALAGRSEVMAPVSNDMLTCEACERLLDAYVEDWLAGIDLASTHPDVEGHLRHCQSCREQAQMLVDLLRQERAGPATAPGYLTFAGWFQQQAPASLWQRTAAGLHQLAAEIPLRVARARATFGELPSGLSPQWVPAAAQRSAAADDSAFARREDAFTELLELPHPEQNLVVRLRIGPFAGGTGALILEIGTISPPHPIPQAKVTLRDGEGGLLEGASSDADGLVIFQDLELGRYQFGVEHAGQTWIFVVNLQSPALGEQ